MFGLKDMALYLFMAKKRPRNSGKRRPRASLPVTGCDSILLSEDPSSPGRAHYPHRGGSGIVASFRERPTGAGGTQVEAGKTVPERWSIRSSLPPPSGLTVQVRASGGPIRQGAEGGWTWETFLGRTALFACRQSRAPFLPATMNAPCTSPPQRCPLKRAVPSPSLGCMHSRG